MQLPEIILGARGSKLSLAQTDIVKEILHTVSPKTVITVKTVKTSGDKNMSPIPLDTIGKGWFTKELDRELLAGHIDIAVHSLKDLPEVLPEGLIITAIPAREDAREALVSLSGNPLASLKKGAVVGTDSIRRKVQILNKRPDLVVESVRGNVNRRLEKLDSGQYDALILAVAGLKRLGLENRITEYFEVADVVPSPGQGALAVVSKRSDNALSELLKNIVDTQTTAAVTAERAFSKAVGGGCKLPVGAYAACHGQTLTLHGMIGSLDGTHIAKDSMKGTIGHPAQLGKDLAEQMLKNAPWY